MSKLVFRVRGIPLRTTKRDLERVLLQGQGVEIENMTITFSCYGDNTQTAIVQFKPRPPKYLENVVSGSLQDHQIPMDGSDISIDKDFYGLTQLYSVEDDTKVAADIVAVTGIAGHAFGSWRGKGSGKMWLRDFFSKDLPNCRTMPWIYHGTQEDKIMDRERSKDPKFTMFKSKIPASTSPRGNPRPIIFIAHSFGGIVITQSLVKCKEFSRNDTAAADILNSTYAIAFFGTPHRGLVAEDMLTMADMMQEERIELVRSIGGGNTCVLLGELEEFISLAPAAGLKILSFYELMKGRRIVLEANGRYARNGAYFMPVAPESALLGLDADVETSIPVDTDHTNLVKFNAPSNAAYGTILCQLKLFLEVLCKKEVDRGNSPRLTRYRTMPHSVSPQFTGRGEILERLKNYFFPPRPHDLDQRLVFVLHGMGGSGKTQISLEFIQRYGDRFWGFFWIDASTPEMTEQSFCDIARELSLNICTSDSTKRYLENCKKENRWLLVIDNADDVELDLGTLFPRGNRGSILVTTRNPQCRFYSPDGYYEVDAMDPEDAISLLLKVAEPNKSMRDSERSLAAKIVHELGYLALAITHAGAFIANGSAMDAYLEHLRDNPKRLFGTRYTQGSQMYKGGTVFTTWELSFSSLNDQSAAYILQTFAFFHYDRIPKDIFKHASAKHGREEIPEWLSRLLTRRPNGTWDSLNFEQSIQNLLSFSLIKQDIYREKTIYSVHPLVHSWSRERLDFSDQGVFRRLASFLLEWSVGSLKVNVDTIALIQLMPHIELCKRPIPNLPLLIQPTCFWVVYHATGKFEQAEEVALAAVEINKKDLGEGHPDTLTSMNNLASTYGEQGRWTEAERLQVVVLKAHKRLLGEEHPDTLKSMNNLASTYQDQGKLIEAERLQVVVLEARKRLLGEEHPGTLTSMNNLALTYQGQGKWTEAERLQVVELEARKRLLGEEHPGTLTSMGNLASTYQDQGKLTEAERLKVVVLEAHKRLLGEEHPDTLTSMNNLASTYRGQGKWTEAERLKVVVLEARKRLLGEEHPGTLTSMNNLALTYQDQGKLTEAERLQVVELEARKRLLGEEHPDTLTSMSNLASTYQGQGKLTEAERLKVVVLEAHKRLLGEEHPGTLKSMNNLASTYGDQGRWTEAERLQVVELEACKRLLGEEHPDTLTSMNNLALTYQGQGKWTEAERLQVVELEARKRLLGEEHPGTLTSMNNLALTYQDQGKWTEAERLQVVELEARKRLLGEEHPETLISMYNLAYCRKEIAREEAVVSKQKTKKRKREEVGLEEVEHLIRRPGLRPRRR